jgi:hypothetical protein
MPELLDREWVVRRIHRDIRQPMPNQFEEFVASEFLEYGRDAVGVGPQGARED